MNKYLLKLYIAGHTSHSVKALYNLRQMCEKELAGRYELEIIDVLENPQRAEDAKVMVTPMVIRELPPPVRRVIGDLSECDKVLIGLDLVALFSENQDPENAKNRT